MKPIRLFRALVVPVTLALPMLLWAPAAFVADAPMTTEPTAAQAADTAVARALRGAGPAGALRDWCHAPGFGAPVIATRRVGALNPLDPARALLPPTRSAPWRAAFVLLIAGWTTYRLLRLLGLFRTTALFGALAFAMHGWFADAAYDAWVRVAALTPALWWMTERLLRRPEASRAATAAFAFALIALADEPSCAIGVGASAFVWAAVRIATGSTAFGGIRRCGRALAWLVGAAALGVAIAWPQVGASLTASLGPVGAARDGSSWLTLVAPLALGGRGYVGVVVLIPVAIAMLTSLGRDRRVTSAVLAGSAAVVVAATVGWTHAATTVFALALAMLGALGLQRCWPLFGPPTASGARVAAATIVPLVLIGVAIARFVGRHADEPIATLWRDGGLAALVGYATGGIALGLAMFTACRRARLPWSHAAWRIAPVVLLLVELGTHGALSPPNRPPVAEPPAPPRALLVDDRGATPCPTTVDTPGAVRVRLPARERASVLVLAVAADAGWAFPHEATRPRRDDDPTFVRAEVAPGPPTTVVARHHAPSLASRSMVAAVALAAAMLLWSLGLRGHRGGATLPEPRPYLWIADSDREERPCD